MRKSYWVLTLAVAGVIASGSTMAYAAPSHDPGVLKLCVPGLTSQCVTGLCQSIKNAVNLPAKQQSSLGAAIASLIAKEGPANPSAADKIQSCVLAGPNNLVTAFEGGSPPVTDIGNPVPASAH